MMRICLTFLIAIVISSEITANHTCPAYTPCAKYPLQDNPSSGCIGINNSDPCPGGKPACQLNTTTSEPISCCCIKYDPGLKHLAAGSDKPPLKSGFLRMYIMRFCPFGQRVLITSVVKNVSTDIVFVNLSAKPSWLLAMGGIVPIIETEAGTINESLINVDYLNEAYSNSSLYPTDPFAKATDRLWIESYNKVIPNLYYNIVHGAGYKNNSEVPGLLKTFEDVMSKYGAELERRGTKYFGGNDAPGMLDYMIWPWIERRPILQMFYPSAIDYKAVQSVRLAEWIILMEQDPAIATFHLEPEVYYEYANSINAGATNYDLLAGI